MLAGLSAPIPAIPARWLYDQRGSELFDEITRLPSYYPTRTETAIFHAIMPELAARVPKGAAVVEFGAGSATKTPILLEAIAPGGLRSGRYLRRLSRAERRASFSSAFPAIEVIPVVADFARPFTLPGGIEHLPKLGFFPGSTIGNFVPWSATDLLRQFRALLGPGAQLLIGMDRVKPVDRLIAAYDDPEGVTAAVQPQPARAASTASSTATFPSTPSATRRAGTTSCRGSRSISSPPAMSTSRSPASRFRFAAGSSIHAENSHKYGPRGGRVLLLAGGWTPIAEWTDPAGDFAEILASRRAGPGLRPNCLRTARLSRRHAPRPRRHRRSPAQHPSPGSSSSRSILSWLFAFNVLNTSSQGVRTFAVAIDRMTAPLYRPIRRILPDFGGIDFSPLVILILIQVIKKLLAGVVTQYLRAADDREADRRQGRGRRPSATRFAAQVAEFSAADRPGARPRGRAGRRGSRRAPSTSAPRIKATREAGMESFEHRLPATTSAGRAARTRRSTSTPIPRSTGSSSSCRCPRRSTNAWSSPASRPTRTSTASTRSTPAGSRSGSTASCPARRSAACICCKQELGDLTGLDAVVIGRSNIVGKPMALLLLRRKLHGDHRAFAHARPARRRPPRRHRRRRRRPARAWSAATGSSPARRSSTSASTASSRRRQGQARRRRRLRRSRRSRRRDHAGAGRRRPDDHRHADPQHLRRRAPPREGFADTRKAYDRRLAARRAPSPPPSTTAVDAELAFARDAKRIGQWTAFRKWADRDAVMFTPAGGVGARPSSSRSRTRRTRSAGGPSQSFVSCDGRTAVNTGPWFKQDGKPGGYFTTVWQRTPRGWRWVYDGGGPVDADTAHRLKPEMHRASCAGKAPGAPIIPPPPLTPNAGAQRRPRTMAAASRPTRRWAGTGRSTRTARASSASINGTGAATRRCSTNDVPAPPAK